MRHLQKCSRHIFESWMTGMMTGLLMQAHGCKSLWFCRWPHAQHWSSLKGGWCAISVRHSSRQRKGIDVIYYRGCPLTYSTHPSAWYALSVLRSKLGLGAVLLLLLLNQPTCDYKPCLFCLEGRTRSATTFYPRGQLPPFSAPHPPAGQQGSSQCDRVLGY